MNLKGKVCLITGGTRGIGAAAAIALAEQGANISAVGRHKDEEALKTKASIEALGRRCELIQADCGKPEDLKRCVELTAYALGAVDILVHSAGGPVNGGLFQITEEDWIGAFNVHVHAIFHLCREVIPQ